MNLHHALYAAAWARRPQGGGPRALAGALPAPLEEDGLSAEERKAWGAAIDYYDSRLASKDLLFDDGMDAIKMAIADGDLSRPAIGAELRAMLEAATPVYRRHFWPDHDRANRAWIAATAASLETIAAPAIARLEQVYDTRWFTAPVRVDVVWVGNRQGAYTTLDPTHIVISSGDPEHKGWASVEIVFHEASHVLVSKIAAALKRRPRRRAAGARPAVARRPVLPHRRRRAGGAALPRRRLYAVHVPQPGSSIGRGDDTAGWSRRRGNRISMAR